MRRPIVSRLRSEWATLVVAVLLFAAVTAARFVTSDVGTAVGFLYAIPISLVAVRFGGRAGIAAGLVACALLAWWAEIHAAQLTFVGYATRTVVLVGVGGLVGVLVERRARAQAEATRWFSMSNRPPLLREPGRLLYCGQSDVDDLPWLLGGRARRAPLYRVGASRRR